MEFEFKIEDVNFSQKKINIFVPELVWQKKVEEVEKEFQESNTIKGFRKGKAPLRLVTQVYGTSILQKSIDTIVQDAYRNVAKRIPLNVITTPQWIPGDVLEKGKDFKIELLVEVLPEIAIQGYKNLGKGESEDIPSIEEQLEKEHKYLSEKYSVFVKIEKQIVESNDVVHFELYDAQNKKIPSQTNYILALEGKDATELQKLLVGRKVGDSLYLDQKGKNPTLLGPQKKGMTLKISELVVINPAEITDEFAQKLRFKNLEELREFLLEKVTRDREELHQSQLEKQWKDKLLAANEFDPPQSLLDQAKKDNADTEQEENARDQIRLMMIFGNIARMENIDVTEEELKKESQFFFNTLTTYSLDPSILRNFQEFQNRIKSQVLIRKVLRLLEQLNSQA